MKQIIILISIIISHSVFAEEDGFFITKSAFEKDFRSKKPFNKAITAQFIESSNPNVDSKQAVLIAQNIDHISNCMQVDPVFMTAKIHQETRFSSTAVSHTGAAGLTQMTGIGIQEIKDQLGVRGSKYAREAVTVSLEQQIKRCLSEERYQKFCSIHQNLPIAKIKEIYKDDIEFSILAGTILLKVFLAKNYRDAAELDSLYHMAMKDYNGDTYKEAYARSIDKTRDRLLTFTRQQLVFQSMEEKSSSQTIPR